MIQILGSGPTGMDKILGMLGIITHTDFKPIWFILHNAVESMQKLFADVIYKENLQVEIIEWNRLVLHK